MCTSNKFLLALLCVWATCFGLALSSPPPAEHDEEYDCYDCVTEERLNEILEDYVTKESIIEDLKDKITEFCSNQAIKDALKNFILVNNLIPPSCPATCTVGAVPNAAWFLAQVESVSGSIVSSTNQITKWKPLFTTTGSPTFGTDGVFKNTGTGAADREMVFDFAVRCGCYKAPASTVRQYVETRRRRKREDWAASSSPNDSGVEIFRAKRGGSVDSSSCGNDNCAGRSAGIIIYKKLDGSSPKSVVKKIKVSNLCHVHQSFRVVTKVEKLAKVFMTLEDKRLLPTDRCIWTITAAYIGSSA